MTKEVLVVDDQPGIRMLLTDILTNEGYHVSVAKTGKEALEKIYLKVFDLVILDYKLPVIDGMKVVQQMEQDKMEIPIILMSGLIEEVMKESKNYHMVKRVMAKPFNVLDIQQSTKTLLG